MCVFVYIHIHTHLSIISAVGFQSTGRDLGMWFGFRVSSLELEFTVIGALRWTMCFGVYVS